MSAASASANAPSVDWDADAHLRRIAAEVAESDIVQQLSKRCMEHVATNSDLERQLAIAHAQRDRALEAACSANRELTAMRTELRKTQEDLAKKSRYAEREKGAKTEAERNLKAVRNDLHKAQATINSQQKTINTVQQKFDALWMRRLLAPTTLECVICMENGPMHAMTACGHLCFCDACLGDQLEQWDVAAKSKDPKIRKPPSCPVCRKEFVRKKTQPVIRMYASVDDTDKTQEPELDAWTFYCLFEQ